MSKKSITEKWKEQSDALRQQAAKLPMGLERDRLLREARQLETASRVNEWLSSPGLKKPD